MCSDRQCFIQHVEHFLGIDCYNFYLADLWKSNFVLSWLYSVPNITVYDDIQSEVHILSILYQIPITPNSLSKCAHECDNLALFVKCCACPQVRAS
jgi:hypothetical protein